MILFCCASELGPPEDLSAIEVILYYYYHYHLLGMAHMLRIGNCFVVDHVACPYGLSCWICYELVIVL